jgi:sulfonate transport system substrate-binding protein
MSIRRNLSLVRDVVGALALSAILALSSAVVAAEDVVRIGYQKSSSLLIILKSKGTLEKTLAPLGVKVQWTEFTSGLPLLEGLNVGSIDISADVAESVPLFAQAAGAKFTYLVQESPAPQAQAILVPKDSPIKTVADLKGKKVAVAKASGSHYLLLESLAKAGLRWKDIEPAYLQPADGRAALERGAVDAWVTWEPFVSATQRDAGARILADGRYADVSYRRFYLAATPYAERRPDVLAAVVGELRRIGQWVKQNPQQAAELHAPLLGQDKDTILQVNGRRSYDVRTVDDKALAEQQKVADSFTAEALLPRKLNVRDIPFWGAAR